MAPKTGTKSVSATISAKAYDAIEEYRWSVRKNLSQVVDAAVNEFIANHNIPLAADEAPAEQAALTDEAAAPDKAAKGK